MPNINSRIRMRRAGHERSKNGCLTCKIRRVKCDETIPCCRRCTDSGRKCEGPNALQFRFIHDQPSSRSTTPMPQLEISLLVPPHSPAERRAFHYFTHQPLLHAGTIDARFWDELVPQLAQTYDFVWDVVVCLGSLVENVPYASLDSNSLSKVTNQAHRQALKYYNRAILNVRQLAESGKIDGSVIVFSYILFASVEFQQRSSRQGNALVTMCAEKLTEDLAFPYSRYKSPAGQAVHQVVAPFVLRRAILSSTLGSSLPPRLREHDEGGDLFKAVVPTSHQLKEVLVQFHGLVYNCYELIRLADFLPNIKEDEPDILLWLSQRRSTLDSLIEWKGSLTALVDMTPDAELDWMVAYLLMYWAVCYTSLAASLSLRQTIFDDYMDHFADIVKYATFCLEHNPQAGDNNLLSSSDNGVIPPLYFCATRCRDPMLRRQALHLIRQAPPRDNLWSLVASERVIAKLISIEESENQLASANDTPDSHTTGLPPEENRFAYFGLMSRRGPGGKQRQAIELSRFEFAKDGSNRLIHNCVWLDDESDCLSISKHGSLDRITQDTEKSSDILSSLHE